VTIRLRWAEATRHLKVTSIPARSPLRQPAARPHQCDPPRRAPVHGARDGQRRLRVPVAPSCWPRGDSAAAAVQACQSARRAVLRGVPRSWRAACHPPCSTRFGGNLSTVDGAHEPSDLAAGCRLRGIQEAFDSSRYFVSYRRSLEVGDAPLNVDDTVTIEKPSHPLGEPSFDLAGG
jgi:hypothetical protein